jgi:DNA-binding NtrC family response regulator
MVDTTRQEQSHKRPKTLRALTRVLSYDDLLEGETCSIALDQEGALRVKRAREGSAKLSITSDELHILDPFMSGAHAELVLERDSVSIRDAGSRNGTFVNGEPIDRRTLADGDLVECGHTLLCYREVLSTVAQRAAAAGSLRFGPTKTHCPEVRALLADLKKVASSAVPVLILAETGAGKEVLAALVHELSGRAGKFVAVDAGAVPDSLLESTFFGHKKGAFSGASEAREGLVRRADRGTLFLDEAGNLSSDAQAALLRVIEQGVVTSVGGDRAEPVDVRWIAATNRELFGDDGFREDLLRRLAGFVARIPPLRQRREDLGELSAFALREASVTRASITVDAARALFCGPLTGNVRQLRAALRTAALLAGSEAIAREHLPEDLRETRAASAERRESAESRPHKDSAAPNPEPPSRPTREQLESILEACKGNVVHVAERLDTHPRQVYRWIEKHGLSVEHYRKR